MLFSYKERRKMLVEFSFGNFRSFKEEAIFSMEPNTQNGDNYNIINTELKRVPQLYRTSGIFGANASGKSNIVKAFIFFYHIVKNSSKSVVDDEFPDEFYALAEDYKKRPIDFGIKIIIDKTFYDYRFSLSRKIVEKESLYSYDISETGTNMPNRIFEREYIDGKSEIRKSKGILQSWCNEILNNRLFLSDLINNRKCEKKEIADVYNWISKSLSIVDAHQLNEGFSLDEISKGEGKDIIEMMKKADLGLENITVRQVPLDEILKNLQELKKTPSPKIIERISKGRAKVFDAKSYHKSEDGKIKAFDFDNMESDGTKNFLALVGPFLNTLKKGEVLVVDELDDSLHPYLVRYLVDMFNNPEINKNKAQLIFTSHAHYLMDGRYLSRDQIWLTGKDLNDGYSSSLYSLSDFNKLNRKNISFQGAYLDGIYGAVPNLESL